MRNSKCRILLASLAILLPIALFAETNQNEKLETINTIMRQSGLETQFAQMPALIDQQIQAQQKTMGKDQLETLSRIMKKNFSPEPIIAKIREAFLADYDEAHVQEIVKFYESDLARKMTALEIQASTPDIYDRIQKLDINTIRKKRKSQIEKLMKETESQEFAGLVAAATFEGFIKAINAILPDNHRIPDDRINEIKKNILASATTEDQRNFQVKFYHLSYEKASDAELSRYIDFYSAKPGKWMLATIRTGMLQGINACSEQAGRELGEAIFKNK
jgi:hypothetical protein